MKRQKPYLAILDVGHGNSAVLSDTMGVTIVDTGGGSSLLEYLQQEGIDKVAQVLLSHADKDHIGGLVQLLAAETVTIGSIFLNTDSMKGSALWDDLVYELDAQDSKGDLKLFIGLTKNGMAPQDCGQIHLEVLAPSKYLALKGVGGRDRNDRKILSNSLSAVIRLSKDGESIAILPGDVDDVGLDDLIENTSDRKAPLIVFPHHGGQCGSDEVEFVQKLLLAFEPEMVVFSVARGRDKHPAKEVVEAVRKCSATARIACTELSEHCASDLPKTGATHLAGEYARGRETRSCCAGTIVLELAGRMSVIPGEKAHQAFIQSVAPSCMCR